MKMNVLGRTGLEISHLGMGGLFVSSVGGDFEGARDAVKLAFDLGVNYVDTAPTYANSEEVLGKIFADLGQQPAIISTKFGGRPTPFLPQDRDCLLASIDESLRLLGRDSIDLMMIHEPDRPGQYDWFTDYVAAEGPVMDVLADLKRQGVVKHIGLGGTTAYEMVPLINSGKFDVILSAFNYSLLWREAEVALLPAAAAQNMGVIIGSPLQQGALSQVFDTLDDPACYWVSPQRKAQFKALYALTNDLGMALADLAIRWVASNPGVHSVLMGARSTREVELNVASVGAGPLPADVLKRLDEIRDMVPCRPMAEPFGMGWFLADPTRYKGPGNG